MAYFRGLLASETERITRMCDEWEAKIQDGDDDVKAIPEDAVGQIRASIGKGRLFMNRKGRFDQFRELVDNCEFGRGDKPTTCMDLQVSLSTVLIFSFSLFKRLFILSGLLGHGPLPGGGP